MAAEIEHWELLANDGRGINKCVDVGHLSGCEELRLDVGRVLEQDLVAVISDDIHARVEQTEGTITDAEVGHTEKHIVARVGKDLVGVGMGLAVDEEVLGVVVLDVAPEWRVVESGVDLVHHDQRLVVKGRARRTSVRRGRECKVGRPHDDERCQAHRQLARLLRCSAGFIHIRPRQEPGERLLNGAGAGVCRGRTGRRWLLGGGDLDEEITGTRL